MKGKRIRTLEGLALAAGRRRSVTSDAPRYRGPFGLYGLPATFVLNWPGRLIEYYIRRGLYYYEKGKKP